MDGSLACFKCGPRSPGFILHIRLKNEKYPPIYQSICRCGFVLNPNVLCPKIKEISKSKSNGHLGH